MLWNINQNVGTTSNPLGQLSFDASHPHHGIKLVHTELTNARFMQLRILSEGQRPHPDMELYARGADLVATYDSSAARPLRYQLYWRAYEKLPTDVLAMWDLIISVQTELLDSDPAVILETSLPKTLVIANQDCCTTAKHAIGTYFELTYPQDYVETQLAWTSEMAQQTIEANSAASTHRTGTATLRQVLFARRLEKGVILRSHLRAGWLKPNASPDRLSEILQEFAKSEPVLTA
jgi:hypothetical protein